MGLAKQTDREPTATDTATMLGLALIASLAAAASAMPTADPQFMYYVPTTSYVQPQAVYQPKTETVVKPTMYAAQPVAQPVAEPFFFGGGMYGMNGGYRGMGWLGSNNMGGKAEYGDYGMGRKYPTYGDYYRTHRYPINDGWMLWDEDLR